MVFRDSLSLGSATRLLPTFSRKRRMGYKLLLVIIFMVAITTVVSTFHMGFI